MKRKLDSQSNSRQYGLKKGSFKPKYDFNPEKLAVDQWGFLSVIGASSIFLLISVLSIGSEGLDVSFGDIFLATWLLAPFVFGCLLMLYINISSRIGRTLSWLLYCLN